MLFYLTQTWRTSHNRSSVKRHYQIKLTAALMLLVALVASPFAMAANNSSNLSSKQIESIRQNCVQAQVSLQQIQYSDAAGRVNRGQAYETLLNKLMAPFNSRVALNRLDIATDLTSSTTDLENAVNVFKSDYNTYSDALANTLTVKCQSNPQDFYSALQEARIDRQQVHKDIQIIDGLMEQYDQQIVGLSKSLANDTASSGDKTL